MAETTETMHADVPTGHRGMDRYEYRKAFPRLLPRPGAIQVPYTQDARRSAAPQFHYGLLRS